MFELKTKTDPTSELGHFIPVPYATVSKRVATYNCTILSFYIYEFGRGCYLEQLTVLIMLQR